MEKQTQMIESFLSSHEVKIYYRSNVPESFPVSNGRKIKDDDFQRMEAKVKELWNQV